MSTAASLAASVVVVRKIILQLQYYILRSIQSLLKSFSSEITLIIEEFEGFAGNQMYKAAEIYLVSLSGKAYFKDIYFNFQAHGIPRPIFNSAIRDWFFLAYFSQETQRNGFQFLLPFYIRQIKVCKRKEKDFETIHYILWYCRGQKKKN